MWNNARFVNLVANTLIATTLAACVLAGVAWVAQRPVFRLTGIVIDPMPGSALEHVTPAGVRSAIAGRLSGNFFTVNLDQVRSVFETVPWVRQASVRRQWPNQLQVHLVEYQPLGLWNENQLLDVRGQPFTANQAEAEDEDEDGSVALPSLYGPEGSGVLVSRRYVELKRWLAPLHAVPVRVSLSERHAWEVELDTGLVLELGRDLDADEPGMPLHDPSASGSPSAGSVPPLAIRIHRFIQSLPALEQRIGRHVVRADLRYPNGFSLVLGDPIAPPPGSAQTKKPTSVRKP